MIYDSKPITDDEKGEIVAIVNDSVMRDAITEVLREVTGPRKIKNLDCLKLLSDVFRFVMALFVHEQNMDYDFISAMLDTCQYLYYPENNRKVYMT